MKYEEYKQTFGNEMNGAQLIDIFILAGIAGFFIYKLNAVLGQRGKDDPEMANPDNVVNLNVHKKKAQPEAVIEINEKLRPAISKIHSIDATFTAESFLGGAEKAFRMIIEDFNDGKIEDLKPYLAPEIFKKFTNAIQARIKAGQICQNNILRITSCVIDRAAIDGHVATITVKYETEQIIASVNENGQLISGDFNEINHITDTWSFRRDLEAADPNWILVTTS